MKIRATDENIAIVKLVSKQTGDELNCLMNFPSELNQAEIIFDNLEEIKSFMHFLEEFIDRVMISSKLQRNKNACKITY